ncbi:response regulator transcription factor [Rugosimonospora acidiphila]|uniref:Sensory transduction protein RegX3 n=1 Tax=Rugosimonospora acidiphila TaxID=556531 RepID=A0ABP9SUL0_9ACTN
MRVLVVEDDNHVMAALRTVLAKHGFELACARCAAEGLDLLDTAPDVVLLDLGLPDRDGFKLCTEIRRRSDVPIIIATARGDLASRLHGLNIGADDYLVKPYSLAELIARIHAITRRAARPQPPAETVTDSYVYGQLRVEPHTRRVESAGHPVNLTRKEFDLLLLLMRSPGVVVRRERILSQVWNTNWQGNGRTLEVHMASLRGKLREPGMIETVRGIGYRLTPADREPAALVAE